MSPQMKSPAPLGIAETGLNKTSSSDALDDTRSGRPEQAEIERLLDIKRGSVSRIGWRAYAHLESFWRDPSNALQTPSNARRPLPLSECRRPSNAFQTRNFTRSPSNALDTPSPSECRRSSNAFIHTPPHPLHTRARAGGPAPAQGDAEQVKGAAREAAQ
jgi:hypothetical protein